jgi:drug/metabolite transporter (DMT)-like permease
MAALAHALASSFEWQVIALARTLLAFLLTLALARLAGVRLVFWTPRTLWIRSFAGSFSLVGSFFAYTHLPISDVLTLTNMFPIWVAFLSWPLLGETPSAGVWLSTASGVAGVALIQQPHLVDGNWAALVALAVSFFTAIAMLGLHRLSKIDARAIVIHFSFVSMLFCLGALLFCERSVTIGGLLGAPGIMLLAVGVTATIGQLFLTKAFAAGSPAQVSIVGLTQVPIAMLLDVLLWDRSFGAITLVGIGLVVAPTAWILATRGGASI